MEFLCRMESGVWCLGIGDPEPFLSSFAGSFSFFAPSVMVRMLYCIGKVIAKYARQGFSPEFIHLLAI